MCVVAGVYGNPVPPLNFSVNLKLLQWIKSTKNIYAHHSVIFNNEKLDTT